MLFHSGAPMLLLALAVSLPAQATLTVPGQYPTIQSAIVAASTGDTVLVAPGTYNGSIDFLGRNITVMSSAGPDATTIVGFPNLRVASFVAGETPAAVLQGFTLTGGNGGIRVLNSSPTIQDCHVSGNYTTADGGGIDCVASNGVASITVTGCRFFGNTAQADGGGIFVHTMSGGTALPVVTDSEFVQNTAIGSGTNFQGAGGGIFLRREAGLLTGTITGCVFRNNDANSWASGIAMREASNTTVTNCTVLDGTGAAGIYGSDCSSVSVTGCVVANNYGSGISLSGNTSTGWVIAACTIARQGGRGIFKGSSSSVSVSGCILWNNNTAFSSGVTPTHSNLQPGAPIAAHPTNISADPLFVDANAGDFHLASNSPCVDAGNPAGLGLPAVDIDGSARVVNGVPDMGADELPDTTLDGTGEDLDLYTLVNGTGDPHAEAISAIVNDVVSARFVSPQGAFVGHPPLLVGQLFATTTPPPLNPALQSIQISLAVPYVTLFGSLPALPFPAPGLSANGVEIMMAVPPGLTGNSLRLQAFCVSWAAANGQYAATRAHDIAFQ